MKILVINAGSSSLKYSLFVGSELQQLSHGNIAIDTQLDPHTKEFTDAFQSAFIAIEKKLHDENQLDSLKSLNAIAHRVVHGGELFHGPVIINKEVIAAITELEKLAPLHNPANLAPIKFIAQHYPFLDQVAVFDTAFHQTLPDYAYHYALPDELYDQHQIRRYGFHGSSHEYILNSYAEITEQETLNCSVISLHLGNGASICAIQNGESIDTSMGFTPLEGLVMGTRSGDIDPAIPTYLIKQLGYSAEQVEDMLNHKSGLFGLCHSYDMADIVELAQQENCEATLALDIFCYRINKVVGGYLAIMEDVEALIFTAGIGEHSAFVRERIIEGFSSSLHLQLDYQLNDNALSNSPQHHHAAELVSTEESLLEIWVMNTDEEKQIAQHSLNLIRGFDFDYE